MLWFPYTQMSKVKQLPKLSKANGVQLELADGRQLIDGIASWWAVVHGYNHPELNQAVNDQMNQFSHVMMGGMTHATAEDFANKLVEITPEGLNHVFFSDSGSIGVEVALKIAIQYWKNKGISGKNHIAFLKNGYHGDTFKAMEVSDDSDFNEAFSEVLTPQFSLSIPKGGFDASSEEISAALAEMEQLFEKSAHQIAAFIFEPIVQCAGGFQIYSPKYLKDAQELAKKYDVLLIADEVATGFGRTAKTFACEHAEITPDIIVLGKALTAGYLGHAATLVTSEVYNAFLGSDYKTALMHGPTFMGNALACAVGLKGIELFEKENYLEKIAQISAWMQSEVGEIKSSKIREVRQIGTITAFEMESDECLNGFHQFALENGAWLRPIGNVVYIMPAYVISQSELHHLFTVLQNWFDGME